MNCSNVFNPNLCALVQAPRGPSVVEEALFYFNYYINHARMSLSARAVVFRSYSRLYLCRSRVVVLEETRHWTLVDKIKFVCTQLLRPSDLSKCTTSGKAVLHEMRDWSLAYKLWFFARV